MKKDLQELGFRIVSHAEKNGASQVEVYFELTRKIEVNIEKGLIRLASEKQDAGCGIRVALGKQLGVSYVTSIFEKDLEQASQDAISAARASVPDPGFISFASIQASYPDIKGLFDKELDQLGCEQAIDIVTRAVQASQEASGIERNLIEGIFRAESRTRVIVNSLGINGMSSETKTDIQIYSTIGKGENQCSSWDDYDSRTLAAIDPEKIGAMSAQNALALRGAKSIEGGELPLILTPRALWAVLGKGLAKALDARQIQDGKSYLIDSLGSQIASNDFEIVDSGLMPGALGSRPFDAEGVTSQNTPIISSGVLQNYLHDSYSSEKDHVENTGNSTRSSYKVTPSIGISNLVVTPGKLSLDDMISEMKKGVLCTYTLDRPNFVTGELSAMVMEGFLISNGEIKHALKNTLFGITMQDLLKKTVCIGSDIESRETVVTPSILIESAKITSG